jgi:hypothetical protein
MNDAAVSNHIASSLLDKVHFKSNKSEKGMDAFYVGLPPHSVFYVTNKRALCRCMVEIL